MKNITPKTSLISTTRSTDICRADWELGLCSVTFRDLCYSAILDLCEQTGIEAIEWSADSHAFPGEYKLAREIRAACRDKNIRVASLGSYHCVNGKGTEGFYALVKTAQVLGAPNIRVWAGERGFSSDEIDSAQCRRIVDDFQEITKIAGDAAISVSVEYHRKTLADNPLSVISLIHEVGADNLFSYWQRLPAIDLQAAITELQMLGDRLANIHVFNWDEAGGRHPLKDAKDFWRPLLTVAQSLQLRMPVPSAMIEFVKDDNPEQFVADARELGAMLLAGRL